MSHKKGTGLSAWSDADRKARREKEAHQAKLAQLGAAFLESLTKWDDQCAAGVISTPEERANVMHDTIRVARASGLLPATGLWSEDVE